MFFGWSSLCATGFAGLLGDSYLASLTLEGAAACFVGAIATKYVFSE